VQIPSPLTQGGTSIQIPDIPAELEIARKIALLEEADRAGARLRLQDQAGPGQLSGRDTKHVLIVTSEGNAAWDLQPLVRMNVMCIAEEGGNRQSGYQGGRRPSGARNIFGRA
jgi:predicted Zn-dependent protease